MANRGRANDSVVMTIFFVSLLILTSLITIDLTSAGSVEPGWSAPSSVTLKRIGSAPSSSAGRIAFEDNLDCEIMSYRLNGTNQDVTSCYQATAFGSMDVRSGLISFAGDESKTVPLITFGSREILVPWPESGAVISANSNSSQGAYVGLYKNILGVTEDQRNLLGQVTAKRVTRPADLQLKNSSGQNLIANFNSLAFSDGGSWLIAEGYDGYFVRINLATLSVKPFAAAFSTGSGFNQSQVAVTPDGRYVAISNHADQTFKVYDLEKCVTPDKPQICPSHNYWPALVQQARSLYHPVHLRFIGNRLISFTDVISNVDKTYLLSPSGQITNKLAYLALGDSYTSGEGAFAYRTGTDTTNNQCHNSAKAYPALLIRDLFTDASGKSVACAGARIGDIAGTPPKDLSTNEIERILMDFEPGVIPQITFVGRHQPGALTISVGGNDIGFGNILKLCATPHLSKQLSDRNNCYATYEDRLELAETIDVQVPKLTKLYKKLQSSAPASTIYAVGYPLIAIDRGKCALNVRLNTSEIALSIEIIKQLNNAVARAATAAGVSYVDIEDALVGHRLCETSSDHTAMNGITAGSDGGPTLSIGNRSTKVEVFGSESYHPNAFGHELIEKTILDRTSRLKLKPPKPPIKPPAASAGEKILSGPKTGRKTKIKQPGKITKQKSAKKGSSVAITVKGKTKGLKPRQPYSIGISNGQTPTNLGTIVSNDDSDLEGNVILLPIVQPGTHEIVVIGDDQLGNPTEIIDVITVIDSETDYDGDGVPNETDSCLTIFNTGVDEDNDSIDDACDSLIQIITVPLPTVTVRPPVSTLPVTAPTVSIQPVKSSDQPQPFRIIPALAISKVQDNKRQDQLAVIPAAANNRQTGQTLGLQATSAPSLPLRSPTNSIGELQKLRRISWLHYLIIYMIILGLIDLIRRIMEKRVRVLRY